MELSMKQAIIYGGAFNPPTLAHHAILQACFDFAQKNHADLDYAVEIGRISL
jgi:nicotinic acid mononucleotide adenylyltransferase